MGKTEAISSVQWGQGASGSHTQLNGWETAICAKLFSWEGNCINEDGMWRRERQRAVRKRHSPSYIRPREKHSLRSSLYNLNSLGCTQSGCLSPMQGKRKRGTRERTQAEGNG